MEICVVPLIEIAKISRLFCALFAVSCKKYSSLQLSDDELLRAAATGNQWKKSKEMALRIAEAELVSRASASFVQCNLVNCSMSKDDFNRKRDAARSHFLTGNPELAGRSRPQSAAAVTCSGGGGIPISPMRRPSTAERIHR